MKNWDDQLIYFYHTAQYSKTNKPTHRQIDEYETSPKQKYLFLKHPKLKSRMGVVLNYYYILIFLLFFLVKIIEYYNF